jgi:hypothetical protein
MNLEIITTKEENKEDAIFYYGKEIARIQIPNGKKLYLESRGELEITTGNGTLKGNEALKWLNDNNHNDNTIDELYNADKIHMSNWFAVVEVDINGQTISDDLVLNGTYDEAINDLKVAYKDFYCENYS